MAGAPFDVMADLVTTAGAIVETDKAVVGRAVVDKVVVAKEVVAKVVVDEAVVGKAVSKIESCRNKTRKIKRTAKNKTRRTRSLRTARRRLVQVKAFEDMVTSQ